MGIDMNLPFPQPPEPCDRISLLIKLYDQCWINFHERRKQEHRITLSVWTLLALCCGKFMFNESPTYNSSFIQTIGVCTVVFLLAAFYTYWMSGLAKANNIDRRLALYYADIMLKFIDVNLYSDFYNRALGSTSKNIKRWDDRNTEESPLKNWNHRTQIAVTWILAIASAATSI
ncbi:MAG: hypothetical protein GY845_08325 [Planctomycetes bacterium]|nr:hypothetical protein [Planctomycetota bacterium]